MVNNKFRIKKSLINKFQYQKMILYSNMHIYLYYIDFQRIKKFKRFLVIKYSLNYRHAKYFEFHHSNKIVKLNEFRFQ